MREGEYVCLIGALADELRPAAGNNIAIAHLVDEADEAFQAYWDQQEPTDDEIYNRPRPVHDLEGYDLDDPKRITLQRENDKI